MDVTRDLIDWVNKEGYAYAEINAYPRPSTSGRVRIQKVLYAFSSPHTQKRSWSELAKDVLIYLWDNYVQ
jgi:histone deacetylase 6